MAQTNDKHFYITTPIYYVNALPHIGHFYSTLIADCFARWNRLKDKTTFFLTGTDEHGQKVKEAAINNNMTPQEYVDIISEKFRDCFVRANFKFDHFIRTTHDYHVATVTRLWDTLTSSGYIYLDKYRGWYNVSDETFVNESDITDIDGSKFCKATNKALVWHEEDNYIFKLSLFQKSILKHMDQNPNWIIPAFRQKEVYAFVKDGLHDISVSRQMSTCDWGIPVPKKNNWCNNHGSRRVDSTTSNDSRVSTSNNFCVSNSDDQHKRHIVYVWLDALTNYLSGSNYKNSGYICNNNIWPANVHVIGKDILKFHAVYWPAFLIGANLPLPEKIIAHGWWTKDGEKISKSMGNVFDIDKEVEKYGNDAIKFYLLRDTSYSLDGDYREERMVDRYNGELSNTLGNLVSRATAPALLNNYVVPTPGNFTEDDCSIINDINTLFNDVDKIMTTDYDIQLSINRIWQTLFKMNLYINNTKPWESRKNNDNERLGTIMYTLLGSIRVLGYILEPFLPETAVRIQSIFPNKSMKTLVIDQTVLVPGQKLNIDKNLVLFRKL